MITYTPAPCAPNPGDCDGGGAGDIGTVPDGCNLSTVDAAGRINTQLSVTAGKGITVTGCGSASSPLVISTDDESGGGSDTYIRSATPVVLTVTGSGSQSNPYTLAVTEALSGTYNGMTFDSYGRLTAYTQFGGGR